MGHKILVVEDERAVRDLLKEILETAGYEVLAVARGKGVPELAEKEAPRAILLDLVLPDLDGLKVCRGLRTRESTRFIPVIILTGFNIDPLEVMEAGAEDLLGKPFIMNDLLMRVRAAISVGHLTNRQARLLAYHKNLKNMSGAFYGDGDRAGGG